MKRISGSLKLELAQYREVLSFSQLASDLDSVTRQMLDRGARLTELLKQPNNAPLSLSHEAIPLFAGIRGYLDEIPVSKVNSFVIHLRKKIDKVHPEWSKQLEEIGDLSGEELIRLEKFILQEMVQFQKETTCVQ